MPFKKVQKITAWSYSRWSQYEECPAKAKYKFLDKLPEPGSPAMERGSAIHQLAEKVVLEKRSKIPEELVRFAAEFREVRRAKGVETELELAYTRDWEPCDWKDWDHAWVRIKIDLLVPIDKGKVLSIVDHKTGRPKPAYAPQLELYALGALLRYPQANSARARLWYLDHGIISPERHTEGVYPQSAVPALKKKWEQRVIPMLSDKKFAPRPGNYCRWCTFSKAKLGPCRF
jgi:hypothetical protein